MEEDHGNLDFGNPRGTTINKLSNITKSSAITELGGSELLSLASPKCSRMVLECDSNAFT